MLAITGTTINVESLMGAVMAVGVGVANGNLVVIFANELREQGYTPTAAAIEAARTRLRPVLMTALAMVLGHVADGARHWAKAASKTLRWGAR